MSLVSVALNQTVQWAKKSGQNYYGGDDYDDPILIKCRVSYKRKVVLKADGEEVVSGAQITTLSPVEIGDRIIIGTESRIVIEVARPANFDGSENRRKVYI